MSRTSLVAIAVAAVTVGATQPQPAKFRLQEATIAGTQDAIRSDAITTSGLVDAYLKRIKAYNGTCVNEPRGILGPITTIPRARQINALSTLNLRPAARKARGFDDRKARSLTDSADGNPNMPDALKLRPHRIASSSRRAGSLVRCMELFSPSRISTTPSTCVQRPARTLTMRTIARLTMRPS